MNAQSRLYKLSGAQITEYLNGRPRDPRVTYTTGINKGKTYPYAGKKRSPAPAALLQAAE